MARRTYGSGSLIEKADSAGRVTWYGKWRDASGRQIMRKVDHKRDNGSKAGLSKKEAERKLRRMMDATTANARVAEQVTLKVAGDRYVDFLRDRKSRKRTTVQDYRIMLDTHLATFFRDRTLASITPADVDQYVKAKLTNKGDGLAAKTVNNHLNFLSGLFRYATNPQRGWAVMNPVSAIDRPEPPSESDALRFLTVPEIEALIRAVPDDGLRDTDRVLYLTAAMTGLRQGELVALRWRDVDWVAEKIRVRLNHTRGEEGTPKSGKGRSVPMAQRVATELQRHFERQGWPNDAAAADRRVFAHPVTGGVYDASKVRKRFNAALEKTDAQRITFHGLRHTFGTTCAASGVPERSIQEWMGHKDAKTTQRYMHYAPRREDAVKLGAAFAVPDLPPVYQTEMSQAHLAPAKAA